MVRPLESLHFPTFVTMSNLVVLGQTVRAYVHSQEKEKEKNGPSIPAFQGHSRVSVIDTDNRQPVTIISDPNP